MPGLAPLSVHAILAIIMTAQGWQQPAQMGPAGFGQVSRADGYPLPRLMGFVVTFVELVGGILLMVGLLPRLVALVLTIHLAVALLPVNVDVGPIAPHSAGAELDLALSRGCW